MNRRNGAQFGTHTEPISDEEFCRIETEYASTPEGHTALSQARKTGADPAETARIEHSLRRGEALRERNKAVRDAVVEARSRGGRDFGETPTWNRENGPYGWGVVNHKEEIAQGALRVSCSGHGGVKLSPQRNRMIPSALRSPSGWYEEDCEVHIVAAFMPDVMAGHGQDVSQVQATGVAGVKNWFPHQWETATGETVPLEESLVKRDEFKKATKTRFREVHANEFVSTGHLALASGTGPSAWVPDGYSVLRARVDATGEERVFLVPYGEAVDEDQHRLRDNVLIDPERHVDITRIANIGVPAAGPDPRPLPDLGYDTSGLTSAQARRAEKELTKLWRWPDNTVSNLQDRLRKVGVYGKTVYSDNGKSMYAIKYVDAGGVQPVSKAAWDALTGVPDVTQPSHYATIQRERAGY